MLTQQWARTLLVILPFCLVLDSVPVSFSAILIGTKQTQWAVWSVKKLKQQARKTTYGQGLWQGTRWTATNPFPYRNQANSSNPSPHGLPNSVDWSS